MCATTVVWDMGGIFRRYFTEVMVDVGRSRGWPLDRLALGPTGVVPDDAYEAMSAGDLAEPAYLQQVLARLAAEDITYDPIADPDWDAEVREEVWAVIDEVAADSDRHQAVLTNDASRWLGERWWETWPHRSSFDAIVDVATLGVRKPAPEPFLHVLDVLGTPADRCVFVDDMDVNCRAARDVGMAAVWFDVTDPAGSVAALRDVLGLPAGVTAS